MCSLRRRRGGGGARKPDAVALTPITRHSVGSLQELGSIAPGPPLGQSGRGPRGRGDAGIEPHFGECLTTTLTAIAETRGSAAIRTPLTRRVSASSAPEKRDGCEPPRRAGVPAPSPAPTLGGWRADDGGTSSLVRGNTARAGETGFSLRSLAREHRHGANSGVRGVAAPAVCTPGAKGTHGRIRKGGEDRPLYRGRDDMPGGDDGALRLQPHRALQAAQLGAVFARARAPTGRGRAGRKSRQVGLRAPPRRRIWTTPSRQIPAARPRLGRAVFPTLHLDSRIGAAGGANSRSPWGSRPGRRSDQMVRRAGEPGFGGGRGRIRWGHPAAAAGQAWRPNAAARAPATRRSVGSLREPGVRRPGPPAGAERSRAARPR